MTDKERVLPEPHKYAVCSPGDIPIKDFYKGVFEEVFIFYHPFIKPKTIDYELFVPSTYPSRTEIMNNCELIRWQQFLKLSGIENYKKLDVGLRTLILGLREHYADEKTANIIEIVCEDNKIVAPTEGFFPEFLMERILNAIQKEGYDWIWCGDEFCTERKLEFIDDLIENDPFRNHRMNLFTNDNKMLVTTHWDSHFSLLCSSKDIVDKVVKSCDLEGFYCSDNTTIYWSLE